MGDMNVVKSSVRSVLGCTLLLLCGIAQASFVNSWTVDGIEWSLQADSVSGTLYNNTANRPSTTSVFFPPPDRWSGPVIYYNMTITGFKYKSSNHITAIAIPETIGWDTNGSLGIGYGPVQYISSGAFYNKDVTSVGIPRTILGIDLPCFRKCGNLTAISVAPLNANYSSQDGVLYNANKTKLLKYPEGKEGRFFVVPATVNELAPYCFANTKLDAVSFSGERPTIPDTAFDGSACSIMSVKNGELKKVYDAYEFEGANGGWIYEIIIPDGVVSIGDEAISDHFYDQDIRVTIPNSVRSIGKDAFWQTRIGNYIEIPVNVTNIGEMAFSDVGFYSGQELTIPQGVKSIGRQAFMGCSGLVRVEVPAGAKLEPAVFVNCRQLHTVILAEGRTDTGWETFAGCTSLKSIRIPSTCKTINPCAFWGAGLTDLTIPDSVTNIGELAFTECSNLTRVTIGRNVMDIRPNAFSYCSGLTSVTIPGSVTCIGNYAFACCEGLASVTIPNSVTSIGVDAFGGTALVTVYVAKGDTDRVKDLLSNSGYDVSGITFVEDDGTSDPVTPAPDPDPVTPAPDPIHVLPVPVRIYNAGTVSNPQFTAAQTVGGALFDANGLAGTVEVKLAKASKGEVKVSASAVLLSTGKKIAAKAVKMPVSNGVISGTLQFKDPIGAMAFSMNPDGTFTLENGKYSMSAANMAKTPSGKFRLDPGFSLSVPGELQTDLLPFEFGFTATAKKWTFPKNASVKVSKDKTTKEYVLTVDTTKGKTNLSSMKLTYKAKDGTFKGTFKAYAVETSGGKKKLKSYTVNVTGVVIDGVGYGEATLKSPKAGPWKVVVE